jgi:hypothetical protein
MFPVETNPETHILQCGKCDKRKATTKVCRHKLAAVLAQRKRLCSPKYNDIALN